MATSYLRLGALARRARRTRRRAPAAERVVIWSMRLLRDVHYWVRTDPQIAIRVLHMMEEIAHDPSHPEPLRDRDGRLARQVTGEHRLVYRMIPEGVQFLQARRRPR